MIGAQSSPLEMLKDPDEGPFLQAMLCRSPDQTADDAVWLRYAELLESRNDPRGEFLRLDRRLSARGPLDDSDSANQARYRQLLHRLRPYATWLMFVARNDRVLNCGQAPTRPLAVRFRYECPNHWETMAPTPEAGVRYCADCRRNVYYCDTAESVERHALAGECIAVPQDLTASVRRELTENYTGMPDVYELWGERIARRAGPSGSGQSP